MDPELVRKLDEEVVDPYRITLARLRHAGIELEWPLKEIHPPPSDPQRLGVPETKIGEIHP